ncbi:MAG: DUF4043 family protein, partial [Patescibacteria group bacterium]|nr:DUF4043 family protein [Patescibacteria group bacterium]
YGTHWAGLSGITEVTHDKGDLYSPYKYKISGKPIEILTQFTGKGGSDHMLMPFGRTPTFSPVFGNQFVKGTGNVMSKYWLKAFVNVTRAALLAKSGLLSEYRTKPLEFMKDAKPHLVDFWSKYLNMDAYRAFYEGVGLNLSTGTDASSSTDAEQGLGVKVRYNPNWYRYNGTTTALVAVGTENKNKIADEIGATSAGATYNLDGSGGDNMSFDALAEIAAKLPYLKIPKIIKFRGNEYWKIIMHPKQIKDLKQDSDYLAAANSAFTSSETNHPSLKGLVSTCQGFAIYEDIVGIRPWDDTNQNLFGNGTSTDSYATSIIAPSMSETNYNAIVVGNSAIGMARPVGVGFTQETDDHDAILELATSSIHGFNRVDICTEADVPTVFARGEASGGVVAATAMENTSSMIIMTE